MARAFSGNINDMLSGMTAIKELGFDIRTSEYRDNLRVSSVLSIRVMLGSDTYGDQTFNHWDEDVLVNTASAWLRELGAELASWK